MRLLFGIMWTMLVYWRFISPNELNHLSNDIVSSMAFVGLYRPYECWTSLPIIITLWRRFMSTHIVILGAKLFLQMWLFYNNHFSPSIYAFWQQIFHSYCGIRTDRYVNYTVGKNFSKFRRKVLFCRCWCILPTEIWPSM